MNLPVCLSAFLRAIESKCAATAPHEGTTLAFCLKTIVTDNHFLAYFLVLLPVFRLTFLGAVVGYLTSRAMLELKGCFFSFEARGAVSQQIVVLQIHSGLPSQYLAARMSTPCFEGAREIPTNPQFSENS